MSRRDNLYEYAVMENGMALTGPTIAHPTERDRREADEWIPVC